MFALKGGLAMTSQRMVFSASIGAIMVVLAGPALADCNTLPGNAALKSALSSSITAASGANGGLGFNMWGTIVDTSGIVCAVAFTGASYTSQWLGSRVISAQKANTGNAFSLGNGSTPSRSLFGTDGLALSSANLYSAVQPGGSLYGLQHSNPVDTLSHTATRRAVRATPRPTPRPLAQRRIRWSASVSAESMCSAGASCSIKEA
jgi:hypothetical protein